MSELPLHPAIVHVPLGLAFVLPLVFVALAVLAWRREVAARAWTAALVLQAQAPARAEGNTLVMAWATDATGLDPHTQTAFASLRLLELVYEPLVTLNADLEIQPALADEERAPLPSR